MARGDRGWTTTDEAYLLACWNAPLDELARALGRSIVAIKDKRFRLRRAGRYTPPSPLAAHAPTPPMDLRPASLSCPCGLSPAEFRQWCHAARAYARERWDPICARR